MTALHQHELCERTIFSVVFVCPATDSIHFISWADTGLAISSYCFDDAGEVTPWDTVSEAVGMVGDISLT